MFNKILIAVALLATFASANANAQDNATKAWKGLSAAVPSHTYPVRGRFRRSQDGDLSQRQADLIKVAEVAKGTSAEAPTLYYLGNTHFRLNQFEKALAVFEDLLARFPKHGLCTLSADSNRGGPSAVARALTDCRSEIKTRQTYVPRDLPVATLDESAHAVFHTTYGDFTIGFYSNAAPETVANFKKLIANGTFNKTYFHTVVPMQSIEGGCPNTKEGNRNRRDDGQGSPGYDLPIELNTAIHSAGAVSMKRLPGSKRAHGSQFTVCASPQPMRNNKQAVFAQVIDGLDIVKRISQERSDDSNRPYDHVWIMGVTLQGSLPRPGVDGEK